MPVAFSASGVKNSGAATNAFFTHWRGRISRIRAGREAATAEDRL
jgi:hypothetical protein